MSYLIASSLSISNNGNDIYITGDDNNVFPKDYTRSKYTGSIFNLIYDLWGGSIQPINSANNGKFKYIARVMSNEIRVGWGVDRDKVFNIIKSKQLDKMFLEIWNDRTKSNEKYKVMYGEYCVTGLRKYGFTYGRSNCKIFNYYEAKNVISDNEKEQLEMVRL